MLELRKTAEGKFGLSEYGLFIDGTLLEGVNIQPSFEDDDGRPQVSSLSTSTQEVTNKLLEYLLSEVLKVIHYSLRLHYEVDWHEAVGGLWVL